MINASGRTCITEILEELADLMEVIYAAANARGYTFNQLEQARADKAEKRGRFEKRILLLRVEEGQKGTNSEPQ